MAQILKYLIYDPTTSRTNDNDINSQRPYLAHAYTTSTTRHTYSRPLEAGDDSGRASVRERIFRCDEGGNFALGFYCTNRVSVGWDDENERDERRAKPSHAVHRDLNAGTWA
jgi:hypothetical protein